MERTIKFQDLSRLHQSIETDLKAAFDRHLKNSNFIGGAALQKFEEAFAKYTGSSHCLGVANGTDALELVLESLNLEEGSGVVVPTMTFAATGEAVVRQGLVPVFCDSNPDTLCAGTDEILKAVQSYRGKIGAVIAVHLFGQACRLQNLPAALGDSNITLIEDAAQAHGAQGVGESGVAATYSFFPGKNLGALGDGGAITTSDYQLFQRLGNLRDHGRESKYLHSQIGRNSRLDALQASFLEIKLNHLSKWTENRRKLASIYFERLSRMKDVECLAVPENIKTHVYHTYVIRVKNGRRDALANELKNRRIETGIHYPIPLHMQPAFAKWNTGAKFPVAEKASEEILSLPMDPLHTAEDVHFVCDSIREILS